MNKRIFVANLPFSSTEGEIEKLFSGHGKVKYLNRILDQRTGNFRGIAFVEMEDKDADSAIQALNDTFYNKRKLYVAPAIKKESPELQHEPA